MSHHPSRSDPTHLQSGLTRALDQLGRTRGSSATPAPTANIVSPTPQRGYLDMQIAKMSAIAASGGDGRDLSSGSSQSISSRAQGQGQFQSPRSAGVMSSNQRSPYQSQSSGCDMTSGQYRGGGSSSSTANVMTDFSQYFQTRLIELKQSIKIPGIPLHIQEQLGAHVNNIGQEFNTRQRPVQLAFNDACKEQARIQAELDQVEGRILAANLDRDRAQMQVTEWKIKKQQSSERLNQTINSLRQINEDLLKKIEYQENQIKSKRPLCLEDNSTGLATRPNGMNTGDPFNSPSGMKEQGGKKSNFAGMMSGPMGTIGSPIHSTNGGGSTAGSNKEAFAKSNAPSVNTSYNTSFNNPSFDNPSYGNLPQITQTIVESPPINQTPVGGRLRRRGAMPSGNPAQLTQAHSTTTIASIMHSLASLPTNTEPGSPDVMASSALVLRGSNMSVSLHDPCPKYEALFSELYGVVEAWCLKFSSIPNLEGDQAIANSSEGVWKYMMNCTFPSHRPLDAHQRVMALLSDPKTRFLFAMRITVNYFIKELMTIDEFEPFSPDTEAPLVQCKKALLARGLANEVRQTIVDRQTDAIKAIINHEGFEGFRNARILHHIKQLRDMLGPLLNIHIPRSEAGKSLGNLVAKAFDTSISLHTSSLTFQIYFPELSVKFNPATMVARDMDTTNVAQMQLSQLRLKLVITPVVTLRDDHGTTIRVKNLHKAQVLTMI